MLYSYGLVCEPRTCGPASILYELVLITNKIPQNQAFVCFDHIWLIELRDRGLFTV